MANRQDDAAQEPIPFPSDQARDGQPSAEPTGRPTTDRDDVPSDDEVAFSLSDAVLDPDWLGDEADTPDWLIDPPEWLEDVNDAA